MAAVRRWQSTCGASRCWKRPVASWLSIMASTAKARGKKGQQGLDRWVKKGVAINKGSAAASKKRAVDAAAADSAGRKRLTLDGVSAATAYPSPPTRKGLLGCPRCSGSRTNMLQRVVLPAQQHAGTCAGVGNPRVVRRSSSVVRCGAPAACAGWNKVPQLSARHRPPTTSQQSHPRKPWQTDLGACLCMMRVRACL